jgi:predicted nucleotidyltransferase
LQAELGRLEQLGVLRRRPEGRRIHYVLNERHPRWRAIREVVRALGDPVDVLRAALADVPGVVAAFVFGSFAREDARADSDVDLFILDAGVPDDQLARRTLDAGVLLGREVNVVQMTPEALSQRLAAGRGFASAVLAGPKRWVVGTESRFDKFLAGAERGNV